MPRPDSYAPPRRRRAWSLALGFGLVAAVVPLAGAGPAGASPAPLVTEDGIGLRVDETAIQGPALEAIETATQPFVDDLIYDGGVDGAPIDDYEWLAATSNLELSFDVLPPSGSRPDGGIAVHADILNIQLEYRADPPWPFSTAASTSGRPTPPSTPAASVDRDALPAAPLVIDPIQATWDDDPDVSTTGVCWGYLIDDLFEGWWDDFVGNDPESTASKIEAQLNGIAQDLIDQIWDENVAPVLDSLDSFGISINQLHTDDHGLIVTADVDATNFTDPGPRRSVRRQRRPRTPGADQRRRRPAGQPDRAPTGPARSSPPSTRTSSTSSCSASTTSSTAATARPPSRPSSSRSSCPPAN